jgi:hypothetical protein
MNEDHNNRALRSFYEFNDDDLDANRQGRLSEKQLKVIKAVSNNRRMLAYAIGGFALLIGLLILGVVVIALLLCLVAQTWNSGATTGIISGVAGIIVLFGVAAYFMRLLLRKANAKCVLRTAQGAVHLTAVNVSSGHRSYKEHQMQIGNALFVLEDELVGRIKEGEDYAVYYLDYQDGSEGIIQSLEKV